MNITGWIRKIVGKEPPAYITTNYTSKFGILNAKKIISEKRSGVLMHITSLPGKYGIGDLGNEAYRFADILHDSNQTVWQVLPLSPVTPEACFSPYSSPSAFAGNTMLISPELLLKDGLIDAKTLQSQTFELSEIVDFTEALKFREHLLKLAFRKFNKSGSKLLQRQFHFFCVEEAFWLNDYALFTLLKQTFKGKTWNLWPDDIRDRKSEALTLHTQKLSDEIAFEKFKQFVFFKQWHELKYYANTRNIIMFGDIPYYVSYDSADVWANQKLFKLTDDKKMSVVAGVPPDYFNDAGQLWNMPVFDWDEMKNESYNWWISRLRKNLSLFDIVRLDHFRGFSAFWEVPGNEATAINGKWVNGPASDFFNAVQTAFPKMPFVAEDLGDINQEVFTLRDDFELPGMNVLQFAFGKDIHYSIHLPEHHRACNVAYTGTHDNNTIKGWYDDLDEDTKLKLCKITNTNDETIHQGMIKMAMNSPAGLVIIPLQDYLGLGKWARMNTPSTIVNNWAWKIKSLSEINSDIVTLITDLSTHSKRNVIKPE